MFTDVELPVRQDWGWGQGEACIPPAAPTPLTLPYTLLYICTVHELCSRTVGEYRLRGVGRCPQRTYFSYRLRHPSPLPVLPIERSIQLLYWITWIRYYMIFRNCYVWQHLDSTNEYYIVWNFCTKAYVQTEASCFNVILFFCLGQIN